MNIINEYKFLLAYFLYYACFEQQKLCCYNVTAELRQLNETLQQRYSNFNETLKSAKRYKN